ncbi:triphosphoribosyl-dephospho-CoA synthase [Methylotenera sp. 1P/1]|jgi:triphosphoribosyl-dephospho-CoA synthase|uniref:triphosphoribosyl-dephospho-CoA synthase n=1 Tax=Methylotenera sp. 1P/1 TaxID=1131551 RepID=UPI00036877E9|nr:triphosphoribosyl-dephospho-CoA synthase [Methylotenera sp. 1P/1]
MVSDPKHIIAQRLAKVYQNACMAELEALKPGNVHIFADGHGMVVEQFITSAEVSANVIANPSFSLGQRIYESVAATHQAVGCNTNLGIILLCAPLIQAALHSQAEPFEAALTDVLAHTTIEDAQWAFDAIQLANPGGLGQSAQHDIHESAQCTLLEAMQAAALRDHIALQYTNQFYPILHEGLPHYQQALVRWDRPAWATTAVYLYWLAHHTDSHVARKYGLEVADQLQKEAREHYLAFLNQENPKLYLPTLRAFDRDLKNQGINPGTSADLTVATLFLHHSLVVA